MKEIIGIIAMVAVFYTALVGFILLVFFDKDSEV